MKNDEGGLSFMCEVMKKYAKEDVEKDDDICASLKKDFLYCRWENKIRRKEPKGDIKHYCKRRLDTIKTMDDEKIPFGGIIIWWLEKHANR